MKTLVTILLAVITLSAFSQSKYDGYVMREGQMESSQVKQKVKIDIVGKNLVVEFGKDSVWTERITQLTDDVETVYVTTENLTWVWYQGSLVSELAFEGKDKIFSTVLYLVYKGWYDEKTGLKEAWSMSNFDSQKIAGL